MQSRGSRICDSVARSDRKRMGFLSECSENPPQLRQRKSRIFTAFRNVASVFLKYWVLEQEATCYTAVEREDSDGQNGGKEGL